MIQKYLADELEKIIPDLEWTSDFYTGQDHTATVFSEGGRKPGIYGVGMQYPSYMVYIRSSSWNYAKTVAQRVYKALHKKRDFVVTVDIFDKDENVIGSTSYRVFLIAAASTPNRIGVKDNIMEYSVNFDVTLTEIKEETTNGITT